MTGNTSTPKYLVGTWLEEN